MKRSSYTVTVFFCLFFFQTNCCFHPFSSFSYSADVIELQYGLTSWTQTSLRGQALVHFQANSVAVRSVELKQSRPTTGLCDRTCRYMILAPVQKLARSFGNHGNTRGRLQVSAGIFPDQSESEKQLKQVCCACVNETHTPVTTPAILQYKMPLFSHVSTCL